MADDDAPDPTPLLIDNVRFMRDSALDFRERMVDLAERLRMRDLRKMSAENLRLSQAELQDAVDGTVLAMMHVANWFDQLSEIIEDADGDDWKRSR